MVISLKKYLTNVKEQLYCNASDDYKNQYITYTYTDEQVDEHKDYFKQCLKDGLSGYKALLFFSDYLDCIKYKRIIKNRQDSFLTDSVKEDIKLHLEKEYNKED